MKITAFNPIIVTPNAADAVALFEELGFERRHTKEGIEGNVTSYDLKYGDFRVNVAQADNMPQDLTAIRMNVRDFDEAIKFLLDHGFRRARHEAAKDDIETESSKIAIMVSPSGYILSVSEHIRKDD